MTEASCGTEEPLLAEGLLKDAAAEEQQNHKFSRISESKRVLALAVPITASEVLSFLSYLITTAQVGRIGSAQLSAVTLGRSIFHITGLSLVAGLASGVGTLAGQAFGSGHYALVGTIAQRAILVNLLLCCGVLLGWTQLESFMLLLGQDPLMSKLASRFIVCMSPALICEAIIYCLKNYLTSQGLVNPLTAVAAVQTIATPVMNHLFIHTLDMGIDGVAAAYNMVALITLAMLVLVVWAVTALGEAPSAKTWPQWSRSSFAGWGQYLRVALPALAMICADWWCFEAIILVAGIQKDAKVQLAVMGILFSTHSLVFMVNEGFAGAAMTRVSNLLGAGFGLLARRSMGVCLLLGTGTSVLCALGLTAGSRPWIRIFSGDDLVVEATMRAMPWMALSLLGEGCNSVFTGVLTGAGRQGVGFVANLVAYWVVGLPLASFMAGSRGPEGMWMAMAAVSVLQALVLAASISRFDWKVEADRASARVREGARSMAAGEAATRLPPPALALHHHGVYDPLLASAPGSV